MGGTVIAFLGGLHHWWPKMFGRMYHESLARLTALLVFVGFNMTFFTQFVLGTQGMPRRYYGYLPRYQGLHQLSTVGAYLLGSAFLVMFLYLAYSLFRGPRAPANPWGGVSLEWQTQSPPLTENFPVRPVVTAGPYEFPAIRQEADT